MKKFPFIPLVLFILSSFYGISAYANELESTTNRMLATFAAQQGIDRIFLTAGMRSGPSAIVSTLLAFGGSVLIQNQLMKTKISEKMMGQTGAAAGVGMFFSLAFSIGGSDRHVEEEVRRGININITNTNNNGSKEEK